MKFQPVRLLYAGLVALMLFVASCGGGGGGGGGITGGLPENLTPGNSANDTGTVTILATDAETDQFSEINLTITRAELLGGEGAGLLFEGQKKFNLLALADVTEVFSVSEVPAGEYDKIRLTLSEIELVFHDGRRPVYPSLPGNGKLDLNPRGVFYVDSDNPLTIELDFDAEKSIHIVGTGSGEFNFRPVVLTKKVERETDTKLIRQMGVVRRLNVETNTFDLCLIDDGERDDEDCVKVAVNGDDTSIYGSDGTPISVASLENGAIATVVGRLHRESELTAAGFGAEAKRRFAGSLPASGGAYQVQTEEICEEIEGLLICDDMECEEVEGKLICEGELVCHIIEGDLFCEEIEEPEESLCEEIEGTLICGELECEEDDGKLICEGELVCDDIEGELVCEEIEEPEEPVCKEIEGKLICGELECEEEDGKLICEGELVCDDVEGELVCEEIEDEDDDSNDDEECEKKSEKSHCNDDSDDDEECDDSEKDLNCEDDSSDDEEECEKIEGVLVCDDDDSDEEEEEEESEEPRNRIVLVADIIWLGDDFSRSENVACGAVNENDAQGVWFPNAQLGGQDVVLCDDENSRPTTLLPGARIYDRKGNELSRDAIQNGVFNLVDGLVTDTGLLAVLVIVEPLKEERAQLTGTISVLEEEGLTLVTELGDRCVRYDDSEIDVFVTGLDEEGNIVFDEATVAALQTGQRADAFGEEDKEGCLEADTLIIEIQ